MARPDQVIVLKICMLDPLFFPYMGGTEKVVKEIGARLVRDHGHEVQILTSMIPQAGGRVVETIDGIEVIRSPSLYLERLPAFLPPPFTITPMIRREMATRCSGADVYHIHNRFWYSPRVYEDARRRGRLFLTVHNARPRGISSRVDRWGGLFDDFIGRRVFEVCDRIICVSRATLTDTISEHHHHKAEVIYNGVDTATYRPGLDTSELRERLGLGPGPIVLSNGRLVEQKGFPTLLKAIASVREDVKDVQLVIIGRGPLKDELLQQTRGLGIDDSVRFVTGIPERELPMYYNMCDVFALASQYEPAGLVLLEALSCGKAVVATSIGGIPEMVSPECSILVPAMDHIAMARGITWALTDPALRRSMEISARDRAVRMFDWDVIARKWDRSYRELDVVR